MRFLLCAVAMGTVACSDSPASPRAVSETAVPSRLAITRQPAGAVSGAPFATQPAVAVLDAAGNIVRAGNYAITAVITSGGGVLLGAATITTTDGVASFTDLRIDRAANTVLSFSATLPQLTVASDVFTVASGAAHHLEVATAAAGAGSGAAFSTQPTVTIHDAAGNRTASTMPVTMTVATRATALGSTTVIAESGVAAFRDVGLMGNAGNHTLTFSANGVVAVTQPLTLHAGEPARLVLTRAPSGATSGAAFSVQPVLELHDAVGNVVLTSSTPVRTSIVGGDGVLLGTLSAPVVNGLATFSGLRIDRAGSHTLRFSAGSLASSTVIDVTAGPASRLMLVTPAGGSSFGMALPVSPVVDIVDAAGNRTSSTASVMMSVSGGASLSGTTSTRAIAGRAQFDEIRLSGEIGIHRLRYSAAGITAVEQDFLFGSESTLAVGQSRTCALESDGKPSCWSPMLSPNAGGAFVSIVAGWRHHCALDSTGRAYCWGDNSNGELGDGTRSARAEPALVSTPLRFMALAAGRSHTCGLLQDGTAYCWGANAAGRLGDGSETDRTTPTQVQSSIQFSAIAAGDMHSCGVSTSGTAHCWGSNSFGQLGNGTRDNATTPTAVRGMQVFRTVAVGGHRSCALTMTGAAQCWGANNLGQLGDGTFIDQAIPVAVRGGASFSALAVGYAHACALTLGGTASCWGANTFGQLGDGTFADRLQLSTVMGGLRFRTISAGFDHTCALTNAGAAFCWGRNESGKLGDGTVSDRATPSLVRGSTVFAVP